MKTYSYRVLGILFSIFISVSAYSQMWFDVGVKGSYGYNFVYNSNIHKDQHITYNFSYGNSIGGKIGLNLGDFHAITFDVLSTNIEQGYKYKVNLEDVSAFDKTLNYKNLDILVLYRNYSEGTFVEIGPQFSTIKTASIVDTNPSVDDMKDVTGFLNSNYVSAVLGIGSFIVGTENFGISLGMRFKYSLNDLISNAGQSNGFPHITYPEYKQTHPFTAEINLEVNLDFGYMASANCTTRHKLVFF